MTKDDLTTFWLHSDYILTTFWLYSDYLLNPFWLYSDFILTTLWLHCDYILTTFWLYSDFILTTFWLHSDYILTTFRLHSDDSDKKDKKRLGGRRAKEGEARGVVVSNLWSIVLDYHWSIDLKWMLMSGAIVISDDLFVNLQWKAAKTPPSRLSEPHQRWLCQSKCTRPQEVRDRA